MSVEDPSEPENPLIAPCKCSGSMGSIHVVCLKQWLENKKVKREDPQITTYYWKNFECELCKSTYPSIYLSKNLAQPI